ncbi:MAG TPA: NAD-binding protein, partial [Dehalococcoidia bacterium]|nr:NAD-binding protein [Dehalococcoidia bacterium]
RKAGVDVRQLAEIITKSSGNSLAINVFPRILDGQYGFSFTLDLATKDVSLAHQLARDVAAPARIAEMVEAVLKRGQAQGWGQEGCTVAIRILEQFSGVELGAPEQGA